jgi:hypothetical protein
LGWLTVNFCFRPGVARATAFARTVGLARALARFVDGAVILRRGAVFGLAFIDASFGSLVRKCPASEVRDTSRRPLTRTSDAKGH